MNILVTGGAGFIGSHIVDKLIELNHNVCVIDNLSTGKIDNLNRNARFYKDDLKNNLEYVFEENKFDAVIHQAAQTSVSRSMEDSKLDLESNILGTLNILNLCKKYNVKKIVYASSAAIYGTPQYLPIDETHPINPESFYGISKYTPEMYIKVFAQSYNIRYVILRYANVYGPRQDPFGEGGVIAIFSERMINNKDVIIYGDGSQTRDFVYVEDVANANVLALEYSENGVFNVSTDNSISINNLFKQMAILSDYKKMPIYEKERLGDIKHSRLNNKEILKNLIWEPKYTIVEGLQKTINFFKSNVY
ncbi:NAD-dependent epimerase/dehydratase family protein [Caldicellulosiruptoraceae bacterium PP1]